MEVRGEAIGRSEQINEVLCNVEGLNRADAEPFDGCFIENAAEEIFEFDARGQVAAVGAQVDAAEHDFAVSGFAEAPDFLEDGFWRQAAASPANKRNHAVAAAGITAVLDLEGGTRVIPLSADDRRAEHYARRVELIHERLPNAAIGADVITGFPGESEADHAATVGFIESLPFTYLHVFSFSKRPGTRAAALSNEVPGAIIKRRARELRALGEKKAAGFRQSQLGCTLRVLTLRQDVDSDVGMTPALSGNYLKVRISGAHPANQWLDVCISSEERGYLLAERVSLAAQAPVASGAGGQ